MLTAEEKEICQKLAAVKTGILYWVLEEKEPGKLVAENTLDKFVDDWQKSLKDKTDTLRYRICENLAEFDLSQVSYSVWKDNPCQEIYGSKSHKIFVPPFVYRRAHWREYLEAFEISSPHVKHVNSISFAGVSCLLCEISGRLLDCAPTKNAAHTGITGVLRFLPDHAFVTVQAFRHLSGGRRYSVLIEKYTPRINRQKRILILGQEILFIGSLNSARRAAAKFDTAISLACKYTQELSTS